MATENILRRVHRAVAAIFLVSIVPAAIVSAQGKAASPLVYAPLPFLFGLILTGTYLLVKPWLHRLRARRPSLQPVETEAET